MGNAEKIPIGFRPATLNDVSHYGDVLAESLEKVQGRYYARGEYIYRPGFKIPILVNATDQPGMHHYMNLQLKISCMST